MHGQIIYIINNPWILIQISCCIIMSVQVYILAIKQVDPPQTVTHIEQVKFDEIDFPILFKVCFKPAFHSENLEDTGYKHIWGFFKGESKYNRSILGWAGHTEDGGVVSSPQGN